jgi:hypothetical protein
VTSPTDLRTQRLGSVARPQGIIWATVAAS